MVYCVMATALHAAASYEEVMRSLLRTVLRISHRICDLKTFTRLGSEVLIKLFGQVAKLYGPQSQRGFHVGLRWVSVD